MKLKQILAIVLSMALVACISVAATVAYLTDVTDTVTNTFTIGDIEITLDEADVYEPGSVDPSAEPGKEIPYAPRVTKNDYQLFPGSEYDKDPTVHVAANSEASYIFVTVLNEIAAIEENDDEDYVNIADQITVTNEWNEYTPGTDVAPVNGAKVYYKTLDKTTKNTDLVVFEGFKIDDDINSNTLANYQGKTVVINAYAIQQANLDVDSAWEQVWNLTPDTDGNTNNN